MRNAPLRGNEAVTLQVLQDLKILDTPPEPEFDALVRAAAMGCSVPMALISFVDEHRQWFKAKVGFPYVSQTPLDISFCAHAVLGRSIFEVPDALEDPRFATNPLVVGLPGIRFYAGVPLSIADGNQIGTLCVMDTVARALTLEERTFLLGLARAVVHAIEARAVERHPVAPRLPHSLRGATTSELIVDARRTVGKAIDQIFDHRSNVPVFPTTDMMALEPAESARLAAREKTAYLARPATTAMHFCLTASSALLNITHELLHAAQHMTPLERQQAWKQLAADTKVAGRAAYRAALVLADPSADREAHHVN